MSTYLTPGVYMEEKSSGTKPIEGVSTSVAAFIGAAKKGPVGKATFISNFAEFEKIFGGPIKIIKGSQEHYLYYAVRNFFTEKGSKCYVVRVMHPDTPPPEGQENTIIDGGITASKSDFSGIDIVGAAVTPAFEISALNEGAWGNSIEVKVANSGKYSLLLGEDVSAGADVKKMSLKDNSDVRIGDILYIVKEITGEVDSVSGNIVTLSDTIKHNGEHFTGIISAGMKVFTPDFKLITNTTGSDVGVNSGAAAAGIEPASVTNVDGEDLKSGDVINVAVIEAMVIVKKISNKTLSNNEKVMVVEFESQDFTGKDFQKTNSRVYERGFDITVKEGNTILETHEHLSLAAANMKDYIDERLPTEKGNSFYITGLLNADAAVLPENTPFTPLTGGEDGFEFITDTDLIGDELRQTGLYALDKIEDAGILVIPGSSKEVTSAAIGYCKRRKDLFLIFDPLEGFSAQEVRDYAGDLSSDYAAIYYPWIKINDPNTGRPVAVPPSGAVAGIYADTDIKRGVHKAPAGIENGYIDAASGIEKVVTKGENDLLYQDKINVIRKFPEGIVVWGARTIFADPEWKYINVRRLFIFLEQSIERGTKWVVFEPNDPSLWKSIERNVKAFLKIQWIEGKLVGDTQGQAFYVKCDAETNPPEVVDAGQVITEIGVAPSKPAEFVVFRIRQYAGRAEAA